MLSLAAAFSFVGATIPDATLIFNRGQFKFAYIVGDLPQSEITRRAVAVSNCLGPNRILESVVQDLGDGPLPVVVVDLDNLVCLESTKAPSALPLEIKNAGGFPGS